MLKAFIDAEKVKKPSIKELFTDVYDGTSWQLQQQELELKRIKEKYPEFYSDSEFTKDSK